MNHRQELESRVADAIRNLHRDEGELTDVQSKLNELRAREAQLINKVDQARRNLQSGIELLVKEGGSDGV